MSPSPARKTSLTGLKVLQAWNMCKRHRRYQSAEAVHAYGNSINFARVDYNRKSLVQSNMRSIYTHSDI
jgi:hypothetical protein